VRSVAHAAYFSIYEAVKASSGKKESHPLEIALAGACAVIGHDMCMIPFDLVKQRMQLGLYKSAYACMRSVYVHEGVIGLYISLPTTLFMNIPHGAVQITVNESCRKLLAPSGDYTTNVYLISGCIGGAVAALATNPIDIVKTRLQTKKFEDCPSTSRINSSSQRLYVASTKALVVAQDIFRFHGFQGFFRGSVARMLVQAPGVAISWTVYENVKSMLSRS
jgi:solute carrier family 25 (mitochondrial iron transporter), member 28/37